MKYPSLATEVICASLDNQNISFEDIKPVLLENMPVHIVNGQVHRLDANNVYYRLLMSAINQVDWDFVKSYKNVSTELIVRN